MNKQIVIIGGGLAGLVSSILLSRSGYQVTIVEKKTYPFHRVCGEYVSNEVTPFLKSHNLFPGEYNPSQIKKFQLTSIKGNSCITDLDLGGFGISRFSFDNFLFEKAKASGAEFILNTQVDEINFDGNIFSLKLSNGTEQFAGIVIGAHGKKSRIDHVLNRRFTHKRSPFMGVKYHIEYDFPGDMIGLHNFQGGYCGIVRIEGGKYNFCYLASREILKRYGNIQNMEKEILSANPFLKDILRNAKFLFDKPLVINEFSFETKMAVEGHILMTGDAAGLITPLCGNGMAMAIHSAKIAVEVIKKYFANSEIKRKQLEIEYSRTWTNTFGKRLWVGRNTQNLFGRGIGSEIAVDLMRNSDFIKRNIIKYTHGTTFS